MIFLTNHPVVLFAVSIVLLSLAAHVGVRLAARRAAPDNGSRDDFGVILAAALTLLGLIIGFSFSMAVTRYDLRKTLEEAEANAIGTEYLRADLLPAADAVRMRTLLKAYTDERLLFYRASDYGHLEEVNARTAQMQNELWAAVRGPALAQPTPISALAVAGMNDVLNSQGYTQAAWWNRIPHAAWGLMIAMARLLQLPHRLRGTQREGGAADAPDPAACRFDFVPADRGYRQPRGGVIHVMPQNLQSLADSLRSP